MTSSQDKSIENNSNILLTHILKRLNEKTLFHIQVQIN